MAEKGANSQSDLQIMVGTPEYVTHGERMIPVYRLGFDGLAHAMALAGPLMARLSTSRSIRRIAGATAAGEPEVSAEQLAAEDPEMIEVTFRMAPPLIGDAAALFTGMPRREVGGFDPELMFKVIEKGLERNPELTGFFGPLRAASGLLVGWASRGSASPTSTEPAATETSGSPTP